MKASILAVGTELTTGQIINKNAAILSEKLKAFGVQTHSHLTIADDRKVILDSLNYLALGADILFVTGGLGPTSDDFTRDVISDWSQKPLRFDEASWLHIVERLSSRGLTVRDMQRQQCYFPEGATILHNSDGTAHGFQLTVKITDQLKTIFVLPGPPREIEAIWKDHLITWLTKNTQGLDKITTQAWDTLGVGESDIAYAVENALGQKPENFFEIGYRVHLPYVEVKLSYLESEKNMWQSWIEKVDAALKPYTITKDFEDVARLVTQALKTIDFTFYDYVSNGYLHARLSPLLKSLKKWSFKQNYASDITADFFDDEDQFLALFPYAEDQCVILFSINGHRTMKTVEAPMKSPLMQERRQQFFAEMALVEIGKSLNAKPRGLNGL
ncbi:MAG: competence/damage-inducible protein A [Bdellovibrionaceae bacterium]|nr:competence/damage-inducible protein A [Bdellovibrio sp.]